MRNSLCINGFFRSDPDPAFRRLRPRVRRLFVRDLTPDTHGNAIGIGLADFTTTRLINAIDRRVTYLNVLTALTPQSAKFPIHFDTDREVLEHALRSLALDDTRQAKVVRIRDTNSVEFLEISEALVAAERAELVQLTAPRELTFDAQGNLIPLESLRIIQGV